MSQERCINIKYTLKDAKLCEKNEKLINSLDIYTIKAHGKENSTSVNSGSTSKPHMTQVHTSQMT